ncbi:hypothetical protein LOK49_LG13G02732 [Camellia lanceoleosa]|uniref:Uncharacterized protein n=1 Tax=Camellia lanceoleosa TaxID=1840588 RepID=A0ACC0FKP7_9ERIC|nr:hypothetical protein LOK49_LG13G02732 [Camellia lanceoleosa]
MMTMEVEAAVVGNDGGGRGKGENVRGSGSEDVSGGENNSESGRRCQLRSPAMTTVEAVVIDNGRDGDGHWWKNIFRRIFNGVWNGNGVHISIDEFHNGNYVSVPAIVFCPVCKFSTGECILCRASLAQMEKKCIPCCNMHLDCEGNRRSTSLLHTHPGYGAAMVIGASSSFLTTKLVTQLGLLRLGFLTSLLPAEAPDQKNAVAQDLHDQEEASEEDEAEQADPSLDPHED